MNPIDYWYKKYMALKETERIPKPELTWEDIKLINQILWDLYGEGYDCDSEKQDEIRFKEALKRFKEAKK